MPKTQIDFSKTIIYKIVCKDVNITDCYVGHTINFIKRKHAHKTSCNNPNSIHYHLYVYQFIRENGGFDNWEIIEIEKYPCLDNIEACKRERYWFEQLHATLNKQVPSRTLKEYQQENKELIKIKYRQYRETHTELKKSYSARYRAENKEIIKAKRKMYYYDNIDAIRKHHAEYHAKNKEKLAEQIRCSCGQVYTKQHKARHSKSQRHQNYLYQASNYEYCFDDGTMCTEEDYQTFINSIQP